MTSTDGAPMRLRGECCAGRRARVPLRRAARQHREERAALPGRAPHADRAALRLDEPLGQREPEARALVLLRGAGFELLELDEQARDVGGAMPMPVSSTSMPEMVAALGACTRTVDAAAAPA